MTLQERIVMRRKNQALMLAKRKAHKNRVK